MIAATDQPELADAFLAFVLGRRLPAGDPDGPTGCIPPSRPRRASCRISDSDPAEKVSDPAGGRSHDDRDEATERMARSAVAIARAHWPGVLGAGPCAGAGLRQSRGRIAARQGLRCADPADWAAARFTLLQAALSRDPERCARRPGRPCAGPPAFPRPRADDRRARRALHPAASSSRSSACLPCWAAPAR